MNGISPLATVTLSRRSFLIAVGGMSVAVAFGGLPKGAFGAAMADAAEGGYRPNVWVTIAADGTVTIMSPASEMGQGVMTTLPLLVAEEMDADWDRVRIVQAPSDAESYGNPAFHGMQLTGASASTRGYYEKLRLVGAQTRKVILASAAGILEVPVGELATEPNRVVHGRSGRPLGYGEIAAAGSLPDPLPQATEADLKPGDRWRYIGSMTVPRLDVPSKVDGSATFGIDVQLPDMLYGAVLRAPVQGEEPETVDDTEARAVPGVTHVVPLPYGVGVIGETVEATLKARERLGVTWSASSRVRDYTSDRLLEEYRRVGRDLARTDGVTAFTEGDVEAAISEAATVIEVDYMSDHVAHATMEPMNATALVSGDTVEVWAPTQGPTGAQGAAAEVIGTTPDKVRVHTTLLGGGFGRRAEADYVIDAVSLAREVEGRPVKVIWSREDDLRHDKYRPLEAQHVQVGLDADGNILGWRHRVVADSVFARFMPAMFESAGGVDEVVIEGTHFNYAVPAHRIEYIRQDRGRDVGFWRGVGVGYTRFCVEGVVDEIAAARGVDPLVLRLELLKDQPRARRVVETVARMAEWDRRRDGRALGLAYSDSWAHCAQVAEVSLDRETGEIRVHTVWCAVDPGVAVQPRNIEAQMISAITHGASHALYERVNIVDGEAQESNFDTYRVMRMSEVPEIHVTVIPTPGNPPGGIGEAGLPPTGPAIANAVALLTGGVRLRHYPFLPERVLQALDT